MASFKLKSLLILVALLLLVCEARRKHESDSSSSSDSSDSSSSSSDSSSDSNKRCDRCPIRWVAYGDFCAGFTVGDVYTVIDAAFAEVDAGTLAITSLTSSISSTLNTKWDSAWNVFVLKNSNADYNAVFVGYAFRDHWLWNNNYHNHYTIVIWKDYNCATWATVDLSASAFSSGFNHLPSYAADYLNLNNLDLYHDPWTAGNYIIGTDGGLNFGTHDTYDNSAEDSSSSSSSSDSSDSLDCDRDDHECDNGRGRRYGNYQNLYGSAYSGVVFEGYSTEFYGTFCTIHDPTNVGVYAYGETTDKSGGLYSYFVLQTR